VAEGSSAAAGEMYLLGELAGEFSNEVNGVADS